MSVRVLPFQFPGISGVKCFFQLRSEAVPRDPCSGGNISPDVRDDPARVLQNRRDLMAACGIHAWSELHQVHGDAIVYEPAQGGPEDGACVDADGAAASGVGKALIIKTADCQPILIAHKSGNYIAAIHAGWRGDRMLFPLTAVRRFCAQYDIRPEDCMAVRGPSLGPQQAQFIHYQAEWGGYFEKYLDRRTTTMNLWAMTRDQLLDAGIPRNAIFGIDLCTASNHDLLFSYRADHACGRQASVIVTEASAHE